ncbi:MAG: M17 family peptidase N-terminal domain-containing protein, partial [Burkholderiaceae bacterium]
MISIMVSTMVRMTTRVTPKLRASSLRTVESNNIRALYLFGDIMDFRSQSASFDALAGFTADALIVVLGGDTLPADLDAGIAALAKDAIKLGDFELKAGKVLTLVRPQGVKAPRLVLAAAGKNTLKSARSAFQAALAQLKGRGAAHAGVAFVGFGALTEALAEHFVLAGQDSAYVYRHTKPRAPAPAKLSKLTLLVDKADATAAKAA